MASGEDRVTMSELALLAAAADQGGALVLPSTLQDPVIASLEVGGHLVRMEEESDGESALYRIQLTRSGWDLARRQRAETPAEPAPAPRGYSRPDVTPYAITRAWRS
jgi:hypothetical protein